MKSAGGDYSSLSAAEAGEQGDLTALDRQLDIQCFAMSDVTQVTIDGWTTDATRYIRVYAPSGERHTGAWDGSKYNLTLSTSGSPGGCITCREAFARFEYLQVRNTLASPTAFNSAIYVEVQVRADGCICRGGWAGYDFQTSNCEARNCVAYEGTRGGLSDNTAAGANSWLNCTLVGTTYGLAVNAAAVYAIAKNVYAHGGTAGFATTAGGAGGVAAKTNCMSSDTSATDNTQGGGATNCTNSVAHSTANFTNVTSGSEDYHLVSGSTLKDAGVDLSGTYTNDFDGTTRSAPFDVGADEFSAAVVSTVDYPAGPIQIPNSHVGPMALRLGRHSPTPFDVSVLAPVTADYFGTRVQLPNNRVGPMALRQAWHDPVPYDMTLAPLTFSDFAPLARVPNNRVGPMALRALYRSVAYPFDSSAAAPSTANRLRRLICSGA